MRRRLTPALSLGVLLLGATIGTAAPADVDWLRDARYGVFMHFLPGDAGQLARVAEFDVDALAAQLSEVGARYFVITLGQNSGFYNAPNAAYDRATGHAPGERCARRDLPLDLHRALAPRGVRLMLYLPCQAPNGDRQAQKAFGIDPGPGDRKLDLAAARRWAEVIQEWSDRYGEKVSGWWFDGGYDWVGFDEAIAEIYSAAAKHGNPRSIVTFNPGVKLVRHTRAEDYTAGELDEPFEVVPAARRVDGSQWHALTYLGTRWSGRETRHATERWVDWVRKVVAREGVVTLDMGPNWDPAAGPIGALAPAQVDQVKAVRAALAAPARPRRADSFLGIHFDFHAGKDCTEIGRDTTPAMVASIIDQVRPDYLQVDCKGHPGLSSYPTKVGNQAPGFVGDPLRVWRAVTAERGVGLYMHYSGVWDGEAVRRHPDWAVKGADGKPSDRATSFFGPYADRLSIPQLRELAEVYKVDGAWVDGDCWAAQPDYRPDALKAFRDATGIADVPKRPGDPHWREFLQFHRERYRGYLRHYVEALHAADPEFQVCSNWAFSDHMPEPVSAPVDWLSGDFSPDDSVNSARISARYLARQGKPWDLMAWSFSHKPRPGGSAQKTAVQLEREAAVVLALGGGFQAYFKQKRDGSIFPEQMPVMAEVARFCRARQEICHHAEAVPQVALLYSTANHYRRVNGLFSRDPSRFAGTLEALLESQHSVELLSEHNLTGRMREYPLIVVPECEYLEPAFRGELADYARAGGNLLLVGPQSAALFREELGAALDGQPTDAPGYLELDGGPMRTQGRRQAARPGPDVQTVGRLRAKEDRGSPSTPAATIGRLGRGRIAATYFSVSQGYLANRPVPVRDFLDGLVQRLMPAPMVEVDGSPDVDVSVNRKGGRLAVNLVNTSGPHATAGIIDSVAPVGPLSVRVRLPKRPERVRVEPGGADLPFEYADGVARMTLPRLEVHSVVVVE